MNLTPKQRNARDIHREQKESARVRQCFDQLGEWTCLKPAGHDGAHGDKDVMRWAQETKGAA